MNRYKNKEAITHFELWWSNENTWLLLPTYNPEIDGPHDKWLAKMAWLSVYPQSK